MKIFIIGSNTKIVTVECKNEHSWSDKAENILRLKDSQIPIKCPEHDTQQCPEQIMPHELRDTVKEMIERGDKFKDTEKEDEKEKN